MQQWVRLGKCYFQLSDEALLLGCEGYKLAPAVPVGPVDIKNEVSGPWYVVED